MVTVADACWFCKPAASLAASTVAVFGNVPVKVLFTSAKVVSAGDVDGQAGAGGQSDAGR